MNAMGCSPRTTDWLCWRMRELEMGTWKITIFWITCFIFC